MWVARLALVAVGAFLLFLGVGKLVWEIYSWGVLSQLGERPALVEGSPRIRFRLYVVVASVGATMLVAGVMMWS